MMTIPIAINTFLDFRSTNGFDVSQGGSRAKRQLRRAMVTLFCIQVMARIPYSYLHDLARFIGRYMLNVVMFSQISLC
jgi:hypothetical protein